MKAVATSGQILVLVLLIVVVALAVGLSVAARNITNLRTSAQTEQSQRAFTTAEGGVEDVLSRLSSVAGLVADGSGTYNTSVAVGGLSADVTVKSSTTYQSTIDLGSVGQIDLNGASGQVRIDWAAVGETPAATIAVTQYTSTYGQDRKLFQGDAFAGRAETGAFGDAGGCTPAAGFTRCELVAVQANAVLLRIRPFWIKATVKVSPFGPGSNLPVQAYDISSTAKTAAGITRKVQVTRTALPQLPAAFDYVLFSGSSINK